MGRWAGGAGLLAALLAGCGRFGYDPLAADDATLPGLDADAAGPEADAALADAPSADGAVLDAAPIDAADPPDAAVDAMPPCELGAWGAPVLISGLGVGQELYGPAPSADGLTLYFSGTPGSPHIGEDIWVTTRSERTAPFGAATRVAEVNSSVQDGTPFLTVDGLSLYFASRRVGGSGDRDVWVATRASTGAAFSTPVNLAGGVNSSALEHLPSLNADETIIVFGSDRGNSDEDLWMATRASRGASFSSAARIDELSTSTLDSGPFMTGDGLSVYFTSTRSGGVGSEDLWVGTRTSLGASFAVPVNLGPVVNSSDIEEDPAVTLDGRELFFSSQRGGNGARLWHAVRECL